MRAEGVAQLRPVTTRDLLQELAQRHGVACEYTAQNGQPVYVSEETITYTLRALGVSISDRPDDEELTQALFEDYLARASRPLPPCVVAREGAEKSFDVHVHDGDPVTVTIELEHGGTRPTYQDPNDAPAADVSGTMWGEASFHVPGDLPLGFHTLQLSSPGIGEYECPLIVVPNHLSTADRYLERPAAGAMAQLYSVRSEKSWGMGDFGDLAELAETLAEDYDFLLINPLHAGEPLPPVEDSPYLPTTRRFINPIYLRIEDIPELKLLSPELQEDVAELAAEFRERNRSADEIDRDSIFEAKLQVLQELFNHEMAPERRTAFSEYQRREGRGLRNFALWCAETELERHSGRRHALDLDVSDLAEFYSWLQFLCDEQLDAAQRRALDAGMSIGLVTDMAVGIHPNGADAVNLSEYLAPQCSVGAPPDDYNQQGQDWSQPPWHPVRLAESGYQPWRDLLRTMLGNAGGLRVDHVLGLFRLYWIPRHSSPLHGTYVTYDWEAMLGILALEAERAGAVLVGEDLGTLEPWVQTALRDMGVLGTTIIWFEHAEEGPTPRPQDQYRRMAMSSVGTHDLPPTLAFLRGDHIALRARLGLLTTSVAEEEEQDREWQDQVKDNLQAYGMLNNRENEEDVLVALHEYVAGTPSALTVTNVVDMVGDVRAQNQPGTTKDQYPNWCIPLCNTAGEPVLLEDLPKQELYQRLAQVSKRPR
ncbi:4-alpha-glucanotransferase [Corynebacterium minutissimum]|uniref:4-alpha-glucanotransferase n=1 Tax=Corynebacterium minutissimum TaxID=38301 RepID=A0A2X4RNX7_9CORY|nr:4-alpha-glucanotransferase [Corynebacterium minutissimum]SQH99062.1 4-alpha-glucanotransferase [Corynebacterium minutissimum]VEG06591.1 4-alpha-glucanotransferase [Corynebacterium minutissimum]